MLGLGTSMVSAAAIDDAFWTGNAFAFTVKTDNAGTSNDDQFTIPISSKVVNATIYWGDDSTTTLASSDGNQTAITHTYSSAGTYNIYILESATKGFTKMKFNNGGDKLKMMNIANWGIIDFDIGNTFFGCSNMTCTATDAPIYAADINHLSNTFRNCTNFNGAIGNWDLTNATSIEGMLDGATSFNQPLDSWDTSNLTSIKQMFSGATSFNQPLNSWDTSSVTSPDFMFEGASAFNQPLNSWDMSSATSMQKMFNGATAFNQDISAWDFEGLTNSFALIRFIKSSSMSTANYSALLIRWAAQDVKDSLTVDSGSIQYSASAAASHASLIADDSWTIQDGGQA